MQTVTESLVKLSTASDVISALQNILTRSQLIMPDLETPYSQPRLSSTNYFAIELKDQSINDIVAERQQQLDAISAEILSLEKIRSSIKNLKRQLFKQKNKVTKSINLHNRLRSALWRLPTEILSQIFHHCLPKLNEWPRPSQLKAPMLLARICRRWRDVTVGVPSLWCRLSVTADDDHWQQATFCYDLFLKRSRGLPLSLLLECSENHSTKLRNLLQPYVKQISSLYINFPHLQSQVPDQPELLLEDLPALQELTIITVPASSSVIPCISRLPSTLDSLSLFVTVFRLEALFSFSPVWTHLTKVEITLHDQNAFLHLLRLCPKLFALRVAIVSHEIQALRPFTHTTLQYLCFRDCLKFKNPVAGVLRALSLPNLLRLWVCSPLPWPHDEFKEFLTRSKCPLEVLYICPGSCPLMPPEQRAEYAALVRSSRASRPQAS
ncbi:hypothetical protein BDR05DRAFT_1058101 [Suillus weaverae]|nr:hypothetical protein BDR05DRAFT_1058101 [Suillus weaverae]